MRPVCNKSTHKYKTTAGAEGISKRIKDCTGVKSANDDKKQDMIKKLKVKLPVCMKCSNWSYKSDVVNWRQNCIESNEVHINDLCNQKKFFSCSLSHNKLSCLTSLQDIPIKNSSIKACLMFDNTSKITLVSSIFAKKNNLLFEEGACRG